MYKCENFQRQHISSLLGKLLSLLSPGPLPSFAVLNLLPAFSCTANLDLYVSYSSFSDRQKNSCELHPRNAVILSQQQVKESAQPPLSTPCSPGAFLVFVLSNSSQSHTSNSGRVCCSRATATSPVACLELSCFQT